MTTITITIDEKNIDYLYLMDLLERHEIPFTKSNNDEIRETGIVVNHSPSISTQNTEQCQPPKNI